MVSTQGAFLSFETGNTLPSVSDSAHFWRDRTDGCTDECRIPGISASALVTRPERTGPQVLGPGGRPSLQGLAAFGAAGQERRPHRDRDRTRGYHFTESGGMRQPFAGVEAHADGGFAHSASRRSGPYHTECRQVCARPDFWWNAFDRFSPDLVLHRGSLS